MNHKILIVDDEPDIRHLIKDILEDEDFDVETAENGHTAKALYSDFRPDLVLLDIWMPDIDGISLLKEWSINENAMASIVMMSGHGTVETAIEATKFGAVGFIEKPISMAKLLTTVNSHIQHHANSTSATVDMKYEQLVGSSRLMTDLKAEAEKMANSDQPIFVSGARGVGKHVLASHIAMASDDIHRVEWITTSNFNLPSEYERNCLFYISDCVDLEPRQLKLLADYLMENELSNRQNRIKLVLAATNLDTDFSAKLDAFPVLREGWKFPLIVPQLNEHREDIPDLLEYYTNWISDEEQLPYRHFGVAVQNQLRNHNWQGNLSELKAFIRKILISNDSPDVTSEEVSELFHSEFSSSSEKRSLDETLFLIDLNKDLKESRELFEKQYLQLQLEACDGKMSELAKRSGQDRTYLYRKIKSLGIQVKNKS